MECQHPNSTVTETRRLGAEIYRRRWCGACMRHFVSVETAPPGLLMPSELNRWKRKKEDAGAVALNWKQRQAG